jgi:hypothetical protein
MIVRGIELFLTADVGGWTEINADKLGRAIAFLTVVVIHFLKSLNLII